MQTATQIREEAAAKMQRAGRYERLITMRPGLVATIAALEAEGPGLATSIETLTTIRDLALTLPSSVLTRAAGTRMWAIPENVATRDVVQLAVGGSLTTVQRREAERVTKLERAHKELAECDEALKEFENE